MLRTTIAIAIASASLLLVACASGAEAPTSTPGATTEPRELAGVTVFDWDSWNAAGKSVCASQNPEGPFLGPSVFDVSFSKIPDIAIPGGRALDGVRMCKLAGVTVINYLLDPGMHLELIAGASEWPVNGPLDALRVEESAGGEVVVAPASDRSPSATALRATDFGLIVAYEASEDQLIDAVSGIDAAAVVMPAAQNIFTGDISGIHFEFEFSDAAKDCRYSAYGFIGAHPIDSPDDPRIDIDPGYLPAGAVSHQTTTYRKCGDVESAELTFAISGSTPDDQYWIVRKTGTPEWGSTFSRPWYNETTVDGMDAVLLKPAEEIYTETEASGAIFVREAFGITAIHGPNPDELIKIAEGLNR